MRLIPGKTKVQVELFKGITLADMLVCGIAMVMAVLLLTIFAFLGMAAAHWLSTLFGSLAMGFLFYALFLACVLGIFYMNRRRWIILPIARMMIHVFIKDGHSTVSPQGKVYDGHPTDTTKGKEADDDPE